MNPKYKDLAEKVIEFFKNSDKYKLVPARDLLHILKDRETAEKVIHPLEKDYGLLERSGKYSLRLTKKGWEFTTFANLEQQRKPNILSENLSNATTAEINKKNSFKTTEKKSNKFILFLEKFWWQILIPLAIGMILLLIERGIIDIGI
ncbi:hypothetical protein [Aequorivita marina]|uniref:hypothetical protein n=1 Tax=Aequorivita marina TaxID=3073654 RepID=UPI002876B817|nr:hypothetical protein [Aequorivita sp. S2608]MDS1297450.1 hypothetical protein [Aequorivita sp. S2608]